MFQCDPVKPVNNEELTVLQYRFWDLKKGGDETAATLLQLIDEVHALRTRVAEQEQTGIVRSYV